MKPQPLIILEGPDGAGKTTLAKQLQTIHPQFQYHHEGPPPQDEDVFLYYASLLRTLVLKPTIIDRFAFGEQVYGPVYRGHDALRTEGWDLLLRILTVRQIPYILVMCLPAYDVCHKAWSSGREELLKNEEIFKTTYNEYLFLLAVENGLRLPTHRWVVYNYTSGESREDLILTVNKFVQENA